MSKMLTQIVNKRCLLGTVVLFALWTLLTSNLRNNWNIQTSNNETRTNEIVIKNDDVLNETHGIYLPERKLRLKKRDIKSSITIINVDEHKLLYCSIEKNSGTLFQNLFYAIQHSDNYIAQIDYPPNKNHEDDANQVTAKLKSIHSRMKWCKSAQEYIQVLNDEEYHKFVILRDPLERLLSGFLDKCARSPFWCEGEKTSDFSTFANRVIDKIESNGRIDVHFRPQHTFCGLRKTFKYYNTVIHYHYDTIGRDTLSFLKSHHMEEYYYHWGRYHNETMFEGARVHITYAFDAERVEMFYNKYFSHDLAIKCVKAFDNDYKLLNLYLPLWISNLT